MARIRTKRVLADTRINVSGRLAAADMGRLERACGEALTRNPLQLQLDLTRVTEMDETAAALLERLRHRGARIRLAGRTGAEAGGGARRTGLSGMRINGTRLDPRG